MKVNNQEVVGDKFAYDGCHKIYVVEDNGDLMEAEKSGYKVYPIENLEDAYENSCDLKFISNWKLTKDYVRQFEDCVFEK